MTHTLDSSLPPRARLEALRDGCNANNLAALHDAISLVDSAGLSCPDFVIKAMKNVTASRLADGKVGKAYRQRAKQFYRWAAVEHLEKNGVQSKLRFRQAENLLSKTFAVSGSSMIKKDHKTVRTALEDPQQAHWYLRPSAEVSSALGIPVLDIELLEQGQGNK